MQADCPVSTHQSAFLDVDDCVGAVEALRSYAVRLRVRGDCDDWAHADATTPGVWNSRQPPVLIVRVGCGGRGGGGHGAVVCAVASNALGRCICVGEDDDSGSYADDAEGEKGTEANMGTNVDPDAPESATEAIGCFNLASVRFYIDIFLPRALFGQINEAVVAAASDEGVVVPIVPLVFACEFAGPNQISANISGGASSLLNEVTAARVGAYSRAMKLQEVFFNPVNVEFGSLCLIVFGYYRRIQR